MEVSPTEFAVWAMPIFLASIAVEVVVSRARAPGRYSLGTALSDLSVGGVYQALEVCLHGALLVGYAVVHERFSLVSLSESSPWTWVLGMLGVDLLFYWWHRMSHVVNTLWGVHGVHHQGEDFNLAVALRQPAFEPLTWFLFYVVLAVLGVPPVVYLWSYAVNRLYQFWIHTEYIDRTPAWFEWVFNTPSHHRVHHGVDEAYLDKNYGAVLILWDRLFGTFEREAQRPTYGTTNQLKSYNPVWANFEHFVVCARIMREAPRWRDKFWVWFAHPAWRPGVGRVQPSVAKAQDRRRALKYRPEAPVRLGFYVVVQFLVFAPSVTALVRLRTTLTWWELGIGAAMVAFGQLVLIALLESKRWAVGSELIRLLMLGVGTAWLSWFYAPEALVSPLLAASLLFIVLSAFAFAWTLRSPSRPQADAGTPSTPI